MSKRIVSKPKYKVGDVVTIDTGWDRKVLCTITIAASTYGGRSKRSSGLTTARRARIVMIARVGGW